MAPRKSTRKPATAKARDGEPKGSSTKQRAARKRKPITSGKTAQRANRAAKRAKAAGATGKRLDAVKQSLRDSAIVARAVQGVRQEVIAAEFEVSLSTVEKVLAKVRATKSPMDRAPMELIEGIVRGFEMSIGDFEAIAQLHVERSPENAIRAKRAANEARGLFAKALETVGKLPDNYELFRSEADMNRILQRMSDVMESVIAGDATPEEAYEEFRRLQAPGWSSDVVEGSVVAELPAG